MKIIGIESSALVASVAYVTENNLVAEYTVDFKKTHSQTLLPMLDEIVKMTELKLEDINAIAVAGGPGSFTGLRIGSATAKGLGLALDKPLVHVPTLDAMAYCLYGCGDIICPIMDAKRGQVYNGLYTFADGQFAVIEPGRAIDMGELLETLKKKNRPVYFLGDGVPVFRKQIEEAIPDLARFAAPHASRQRAAAVAALGLELLADGKTVSAAEETPEYYRISQAEREKKARAEGEA